MFFRIESLEIQCIVFCLPHTSPVRLSLSQISGDAEAPTEDEFGNNALMLAAKAGSVRLAQSCIQNRIVDPNLFNVRGETALHVAAAYDNLEICKMLVTAGSTTTCSDGGGDTPLHSAVSSGSFRAAEFLISSGAKPNASNLAGASPLHQCAALGHANCAELLINHGAIIDAETKRGQTPLHYAATAGENETLQLLLEAGAAPNMANEDGETCAHIVCRQGRDDMLHMLLASGCDPNTVNAMGESPCHLAASYGYYDCVECLSLYNLDVAIRNSKGRTAVEEATLSGHVHIVDFVESLVPAEQEDEDDEKEDEGEMETSEESAKTASAKSATTAQAPELQLMEVQTEGKAIDLDADEDVGESGTSPLPSEGMTELGGPSLFASQPFSDEGSPAEGFGPTARSMEEEQKQVEKKEEDSEQQNASTKRDDNITPSNQGNGRLEDDAREKVTPKVAAMVREETYGKALANVLQSLRDGDLAKDTEELKDPNMYWTKQSDGENIYYYNTMTQESSWDPPSALVGGGGGGGDSGSHGTSGDLAASSDVVISASTADVLVGEQEQSTPKLERLDSDLQEEEEQEAAIAAEAVRQAQENAEHEESQRSIQTEEGNDDGSDTPKDQVKEKVDFQRSITADELYSDLALQFAEGSHEETTVTDVVGDQQFARGSGEEEAVMVGDKVQHQLGEVIKEKEQAQVVEVDQEEEQIGEQQHHQQEEQQELQQREWQQEEWQQQQQQQEEEGQKLKQHQEQQDHVHWQQQEAVYEQKEAVPEGLQPEQVEGKRLMGQRTEEEKVHYEEDVKREQDQLYEQGQQHFEHEEEYSLEQQRDQEHIEADQQKHATEEKPGGELAWNGEAQEDLGENAWEGPSYSQGEGSEQVEEAQSQQNADWEQYASSGIDATYAEQAEGEGGDDGEGEAVDQSQGQIQAQADFVGEDQRSDAWEVKEVVQKDEWTLAHDDQSGYDYYINSRTGETQWEKPQVGQLGGEEVLDGEGRSHSKAMENHDSETSPKPQSDSWTAYLSASGEEHAAASVIQKYVKVYREKSPPPAQQEGQVEKNSSTVVGTEGKHAEPVSELSLEYDGGATPLPSEGLTEAVEGPSLFLDGEQGTNAYDNDGDAAFKDFDVDEEGKGTTPLPSVGAVMGDGGFDGGVDKEGYVNDFDVGDEEHDAALDTAILVQQQDSEVSFSDAAEAEGTATESTALFEQGSTAFYDDSVGQEGSTFESETSETFKELLPPGSLLSASLGHDENDLAATNVPGVRSGTHNRNGLGERKADSLELDSASDVLGGEGGSKSSNPGLLTGSVLGSPPGPGQAEDSLRFSEDGEDEDFGGENGLGDLDSGDEGLPLLEGKDGKGGLPELTSIY